MTLAGPWSGFGASSRQNHKFMRISARALYSLLMGKRAFLESNGLIAIGILMRISPLRLSLLHKIVPNPPVQTEWGELPVGDTRDANQHYQNLKPYIERWQAWISSHKDDLRKLEPTGEGVDLSRQACNNGKPRQPRTAGASSDNRAARRR